MGAGEGLPVEMGGPHVLVAEQGPEPVGVVVGDGRLVAHPTVEVVGIGEVLVRERIEPRWDPAVLRLGHGLLPGPVGRPGRR